MSNATVSKYVADIIIVVLVIFSIMLHEIGHGYVAYKLGDNTAKDQGRLTLNPFKHLDLFGSVLLPLMLAFTGAPIIGYAKPVPYNPNNLRNRRSGELAVGLAGPATNLILALIGTLLAHLAQMMYTTAPQFAYGFWQVSVYFIEVNLFLMFFNLIPLPPLDGSSIIAPFLSDHALENYYKVQRYSMPILLIVMIVLPWLCNIDPVGWYLNHTALKLTNVLVKL